MQAKVKKLDPRKMLGFRLEAIARIERGECAAGSSLRAGALLGAKSGRKAGRKV